MAHASAKDGSRCVGRGRWSWSARANYCGACGAFEPSKLPKIPAPKRKPLTDAQRAEFVRKLHCISCADLLGKLPVDRTCDCACHAKPRAARAKKGG